MNSGTALPVAVLRHGETDWNVERRIQGRTDIPLNATGVAQAAASARLLGSAEWTGVLVSPLDRAQETGRIIADALGLPAPAIDERLIERDFGPAEGLLVSESQARWAGLDIDGAEPLDALADRGHTALTEIAREQPGSIVISHGALMRSAFGVLLGERAPRIANGEVWTLTAGPGSDVDLVRLGEPELEPSGTLP